jgi:hypothetical protein
VALIGRGRPNDWRWSRTGRPPDTHMVIADWMMESVALADVRNLVVQGSE